MPPTILLTRPQRQSEATAAALNAEGWRTIIWPMTVIERLISSPPDLTGAQAVLLTSPRGAEAFHLTSPTGGGHHSILALTVGPATTEAARAAGFETVIEASGDGKALAALAKQHLGPARGRVVHVGGADMATNLAADLATAGFQTQTITAYRARAADQPGDIPPLGLSETHLHTATFYSPRASAIFSNLVRKVPLDLTTTTAVAISKRAAEPLAFLDFARVIIATAPNGPAMHTAIRGTAPLKP